MGEQINRPFVEGRGEKPTSKKPVLDNRQYNVDESVILAALEKDPKLFRDIKEPSEQMISYMVRNHPQNLSQILEQKRDINHTYVDILDLQDIIYAVKQNPYNVALLWKNPFRYDGKQEEEVCLIAVQKNGLAIKFMTEPSIEIQKMAVENNPEALLHINNPHIDVVKRALELKPDLFKKIEDIQKKIQNEDGNIEKRIDDIVLEMKLLCPLYREEKITDSSIINIDIGDLHGEQAEVFIKSVLAKIPLFLKEKIVFLNRYQGQPFAARECFVMSKDYKNILILPFPPDMPPAKAETTVERIKELYLEKNRLQQQLLESENKDLSSDMDLKSTIPYFVDKLEKQMKRANFNMSIWEQLKIVLDI